MAFVKISEQPSLYNDLEKKSVGELLRDINNEDKKVALAVEKALPQIEKLVTGIVARMKRGGRIFYMGAGTSGRLGVLDASEIPPTFGMDPSWVIGIIAGGDKALRCPTATPSSASPHRAPRPTSSAPLRSAAATAYSPPPSPPTPTRL